MVSDTPHAPKLYVLGHPNPPRPPTYDGSKRRRRTFSDLEQARAQVIECLDDGCFSLFIVEMPAASSSIISCWASTRLGDTPHCQALDARS